MLKAIVFDYNGTLVDDLDLAVESYYRAGAERGTGFPARRSCSTSPAASAKRGLYFGDVSDAEWAAIIERRKAFTRTWRVPTSSSSPDGNRPDRPVGSIPLGVLSNTFRELFERLFPAHLAALFQASLFFDEVSDPKPSPAPCGHAAYAGAGRGRVRLRGRCDRDVQMARSPGVRSFALPTGACTSRSCGMPRRLGRPGPGRAPGMPAERGRPRKSLNRKKPAAVAFITPWLRCAAAGTPPPPLREVMVLDIFTCRSNISPWEEMHADEDRRPESQRLTPA